MSITGPQLFFADFGALGTAATPTHTYTGIECEACEPTETPIAEVRTKADGSVDRVPSPVQRRWKLKLLRTQFEDTDSGVAVLKKIRYWFYSGGPWFLRATTAEWIDANGNTTTWIPVVPLGELALPRENNLYMPEFEVQECAPISITAP